jgi:hypothetical protein
VDDEQDLKLAFILFYLNKIAQRYTADMISVACNPGMSHAKCFKGDRQIFFATAPKLFEPLNQNAG